MMFPIGTVFRIQVRSPEWDAEGIRTIGTEYKHYKVDDIDKNPDTVQSFYVFMEFNKNNEYMGRNDYTSETIHDWAERNDDVEVFRPDDDSQVVPQNVLER